MKKLNFLCILFLCITDFLFSQTPVYYPGFPMIVDSLRKQFQKAGGPLITDLENDGQKEIIFFSVDYNSAANPPGKLYVIKSDGSNYSNFPKGYNELILDKASGDIDGDGFLDIVFRMTNSIDAIDRFGNHLPGFPIAYSGDINPFKPINIYDLDNDGLLEIIVCKNGESTVFNSNGSLRNGWPQYYQGVCQTNAAIGDIDNDGFAEIIVPIYSIDPIPKLRIYKSNGANFSDNWPISYDSSYWNGGASPSLIINEYNSDSTYILMNSNTSAVGGYSSNRLTKYSIDGKIINRGYNNVLNALGTIIIGDVNRDGKPEFANGNQGYPSALTLYSNELIRYAGWPNEGVGQFWATPVIGKLSSSNDLVVADNNWDALDPVGFGNVFAYNKDGSPLPWSPLRPIGLVNSIALADLNNDGSVEIIATSSKTGNETYLHIWTIPGIPFTYEDFPWPQNGHDRYKTNQYGFIPPDEPVGIQPTSNIIPDKFSLHQNYPNPFNPATTIKFDIISNTSKVYLLIYDALGREIETLVNERLKPGTYSLTFDGSNYNSGVYFYKLTTDSYSESKKMLLIK